MAGKLRAPNALHVELRADFFLYVFNVKVIGISNGACGMPCGEEEELRLGSASAIKSDVKIRHYTNKQHHRHRHAYDFVYVEAK